MVIHLNVCVSHHQPEASGKPFRFRLIVLSKLMAYNPLENKPEISLGALPPGPHVQRGVAALQTALHLGGLAAPQTPGQAAAGPARAAAEPCQRIV